MKKIILVFAILASIQLSAQSFYRGALIADLTTGIDIYNTTYHSGLKGTTYTADHNDRAGSHGPTLGLEYGLGKWFGLGARGKFDTYYTSKDKTTGTTPAVTAFEVGLILNAHVVRKDHFDLALGFDAGYSNLLYKTNDAFGTELYGSGSWFNFHITPRYYFGRFGLNMSFNFPTVNYPNMTSSSNALNSTFYSSWKGTGFGVNFGIQYRFLKER